MIGICFIYLRILRTQRSSFGLRILRASPSGFYISSYFIIPKSYFINYTIPFYNTSSIPNFYFPILLIKIIYLHNKIIFLHNKIIFLHNKIIYPPITVIYSFYSTTTNFIENTITTCPPSPTAAALHTPDTTTTSNNP